MMPTKFNLRFGAMSEPLAVQLSQQQLMFDKKKLSYFQKVSDALILLYIHGYIAPKQKEQKQDKLFKEITKHLNELNPSR